MLTETSRELSEWALTEAVIVENSLFAFSIDSAIASRVSPRLLMNSVALFTHQRLSPSKRLSVLSLTESF